MQPRCRQVPPPFSFSMTATLGPSWAPRMAPTYPAEPPPMTATSNASSGIRFDCSHPHVCQGRGISRVLTLQGGERGRQLRVLGEVIGRRIDRVLILRAGERHGLVRGDAGLLDRVAG